MLLVAIKVGLSRPTLDQPSDRTGRSHRQRPRSRKRRDGEDDTIVISMVDKEGLLAALGMMGKGAIDESEPTRLVDHPDDPTRPGRPHRRRSKRKGKDHHRAFGERRNIRFKNEAELGLRRPCADGIAPAVHRLGTGPDESLSAQMVVVGRQLLEGQTDVVVGDVLR